MALQYLIELQLLQPGLLGLLPMKRVDLTLHVCEWRTATAIDPFPRSFRHVQLVEFGSRWVLALLGALKRRSITSKDHRREPPLNFRLC